VQTRSPKTALEICILAGGLSTRMGRDKSRIKINGVTTLQRIRRVAALMRRADEKKLRLRVLRQDAVPRCGPLGGIVTALRNSRADAVLFLACDMPLISSALLRRLIGTSRKGSVPVFAAQSGRASFPLLLPISSLALAEQQIAEREFSLQSLVKKLNAKRVIVSSRSRELFNVNTPADLKTAAREFDCALSDAR
jgi:molybdopterin-guanine dinucleotide biosynthesis protein A